MRQRRREAAGGNHTGTEFREVVCDENGIGGDGKSCGGNEAQLGCITVLLVSHKNGSRELPRCGAPSLLQKSPPPQRGIQQKFLLD
jgi:hypothetical protein